MPSPQPAIVVPCPQCKQRNRIPVAQLNQHARCGTCHGSIHQPGDRLTLDRTSLETLLAHTSRPVLVDFWAPWSQPARFLGSELVRVARDMAADVLVADVNVAEDSEIAQRYNLCTVPVLALYRNGREIWRTAGARSAAHLESELRTALSTAASAVS